jgi:hypothetical protein
MGDSRILVDTPATLSVTFYDGAETVVDPGTVTITITRADGTVVMSGAATVGTGAAARTYVLAAQTRLDHLTAVWTGTTAGRKATTRHEVVGGFYAELAEIRALDALTNLTSYPTAKLETARLQAESRFEEATGVAWVPRHALETLTGRNSNTLLLRYRPPRTLIAATIAGTVVSDLATLRLEPYGLVSRTVGLTFPRPVTTAGNVTVEYTYGYDTPPADLKQAFLAYVRYLLLDTRSRIPDRASVMTTDSGTFTLVTAGFRRPTGLPEVDAVLNDYDMRVPGVAAV